MENLKNIVEPAANCGKKLVSIFSTLHTWTCDFQHGNNEKIEKKTGTKKF